MASSGQGQLAQHTPVDDINSAPLGPDHPPLPMEQLEEYDANNLIQRRMIFHARVAATFDQHGIDHVTWGSGAHVIHGVIMGCDNDQIKFVVPDEQLGKACRVLLEAGGKACTGEKTCAVFNPPPRFLWPERPAQHVHHLCFGYPCYISLFRQSRCLPFVPSLKLSPVPPEGSPGSAWGVVTADTYRAYFYHWPWESKRGSLSPLRSLPPHRLAEAYISLMIRAEPGSEEEYKWSMAWDNMYNGYLLPGQEEKFKATGMSNARCELDPRLLPPNYRRLLSYYYNYTRHTLPWRVFVNVLRRAEGRPLLDPNLGNLPLTLLGGAEEEEAEKLYEEDYDTWIEEKRESDTRRW